MNENEILNRLDKTFVFITSFSSSFRFEIAKFTNENMNTLKIWLHKLYVEPYDTIANKRLRNAYACELLKCMAMGKLTLPFTIIPDLGELEPIPIKTAVDPEPEWLQDFVSAKDDNHIANVQTLMSSKVCDNGKGACAYVAVSMDRNNSLMDITGLTQYWEDLKEINKYR